MALYHNIYHLDGSNAWVKSHLCGIDLSYD